MNFADIQFGEPQQPIAVDEQDTEKMEEQKFLICESQMIVCLSLLMDVKMKGELLKMQFNIHGSIAECIKELSGKLLVLHS